MAGFTDFTPEKKERFLKALRDQPNVSRACRLAAISRPTAYAHRDKEDARYDAGFASEWEDALKEGVDRMDEEVYRRAFKGTLKPVYQQGKEVGKIREYSDTLAIFLMKAHDPEKYSDKVRQEHTGKDGAPIEHKIHTIEVVKTSKRDG